jgi:hypothetical protein
MLLIRRRTRSLARSGHKRLRIEWRINPHLSFRFPQIILAFLSAFVFVLFWVTVCGSSNHLGFRQLYFIATGTFLWRWTHLLLCFDSFTGTDNIFIPIPFFLFTWFFRPFLVVIFSLFTNYCRTKMVRIIKIKEIYLNQKQRVCWYSSAASDSLTLLFISYIFPCFSYTLNRSCINWYKQSLSINWFS